MNLKIYIASPYFSGDQAANVRRQIDASHILMDMGHTPFVPLLSHFHHLVHPRTEKDWLKWDLSWLKSCDVLLRIKPFDKDGNIIPSPGADLEEKTARESGMTVYIFNTIEEIKKFSPEKK